MPSIATGGADVKTGGRDINTGGRDINTGGRDINTGGRDINQGGRDINQGGQDALGELDQIRASAMNLKLQGPAVGAPTGLANAGVAPAPLAQAFSTQSITQATTPPPQLDVMGLIGGILVYALTGDTSYLSRAMSGQNSSPVGGAALPPPTFGTPSFGALATNAPAGGGGGGGTIAPVPQAGAISLQAAGGY
jgi:hypothetical protein